MQTPFKNKHNKKLQTIVREYSKDQKLQKVKEKMGKVL